MRKRISLLTGYEQITSMCNLSQMQQANNFPGLLVLSCHPQSEPRKVMTDSSEQAYISWEEWRMLVLTAEE